MALHLVRHAKAGRRSEWEGPDEARPLSGAGRRQAEAVADLLGDRPVKRVLSSRSLRCVQTVEPLAARLGLEVEVHTALCEDADLRESWALLEELTGTEAVLCSHGNVLPPLVDRALVRGAHLHGPAGNRKGSVWELEPGPDGAFVAATYTDPRE